MSRILPKALTLVIALALSACAGMPGREPILVNVAGLEQLPGQGMELRMLVKLRMQNPNDSPLEYDGIYVKLDVLDNTFATGVSDERGRVPRFGEAVIGVPVSVSMLRVALNALRLLDGKPVERLRYKLEGKLSSPGLGATSFRSQGDLALPDLN